MRSGMIRRDYARRLVEEIVGRGLADLEQELRALFEAKLEPDATSTCAARASRQIAVARETFDAEIKQRFGNDNSQLET